MLLGLRPVLLGWRPLLLSEWKGFGGNAEGRVLTGSSDANDRKIHCLVFAKARVFQTVKLVVSPVCPLQKNTGRSFCNGPPSKPPIQ